MGLVVRTKVVAAALGSRENPSLAASVSVRRKLASNKLPLSPLYAE